MDPAFRTLKKSIWATLKDNGARTTQLGAVWLARYSLGKVDSVPEAFADDLRAAIKLGVVQHRYDAGRAAEQTERERPRAYRASPAPARPQVTSRDLAGAYLHDALSGGRNISAAEAIGLARARMARDLRAIEEGSHRPVRSVGPKVGAR